MSPIPPTPPAHLAGRARSPVPVAAPAVSSRAAGLLAALALVAASGSSTPLAAAALLHQVVDEAARPAATPGWIGVTYQVTVQGDARGARSDVVVTAVDPESPAARAGLTPGDALVRIEGRPATGETLALLGETLRAGQRVRVTVVRDGRAREMTVVAGARPAWLVQGPAAVDLALDSFRTLAFRRLDSLRVALFTGPLPQRDAGTGVGTESGRSGLAPMGPTEPALEVWWRDRDREVAARVPFDAFFERGLVPWDSLPALLAAVEDEVRQVRGAEAARVRELARRMERGAQRIDGSDPELVRLRSRREVLERRRDELRGALRGPSLGSGPRLLVRTTTDSAATPVVWAFPDPDEVPRPLAPYIAGRNRVAGAELAPLNPSLAEYFAAARGLLVVDVAPGTPAADAGLVPGDVLVRAGGRELAEVEDFRGVLARAGDGGVGVSVVRKGRRLETRLPR